MPVRPRLVLGLGGELAGDDAVGLHLARALAADPGIPRDVEVVCGGADLLRHADLLRGRSHVLLLDALEARPGETEPLIGDHPLPGLDLRQGHAHQLSAPQALQLLLLSEPGLARVRFTWFLVPVSHVHAGAALSAGLAARMPALLATLTRHLH